MNIPFYYICVVTKRESILSAALKLLVVNGLHATPMSEIAKAANTGMGTIYNYFANKEILINAIYLDIKQKEKTILSMPEEQMGIKDKFEHFYTVVTDFYIVNPLYFKFIEQLQHTPIITEESRAVGYEAITSVVEVLKAGQTEGIIKKIDIEELLQFLGVAVISHARWVLQYSKNKQNSNNQLRLIWDAIKM